MGPRIREDNGGDGFSFFAVVESMGVMGFPLRENTGEWRVRRESLTAHEIPRGASE